MKTNLYKRTRMILGMTLLSSATFLWGQAEPQRAAERLPLPILYRHFLAYQNHLDRAADKLNQEGRDGSELRDHFQRKLGFSVLQFNKVRATALRLEAKLQEHDAKIRNVIDTSRAKYPRVLRGPEELPPLPPELIELQRERDALIEKEVADLKSTLGAKRASQLDALIENDFAPNVTVQSIQPRVKEPRAKPTSPAQSEAR